jgi:glycosyltransferase involved in cell wall biosynthesis
MQTPKVSVIVPCYNEQATIRLLLDALFSQSFPLENMEIVIADGLSTDRTRDEISSFHVEHPGLLLWVVENPARKIPAGLNRAI